MSIILFVIATVLVILLGVPFFVFTFFYYLVKLGWKKGIREFERYCLDLAISLDQFGGVVCREPFNLLFIKKGGVKFVDVDFTVSYVIAINYNLSKLTWLGRVLAWVLEVLDKGHLQKAIDKQRENDMKACKRTEK